MAVTLTHCHNIHFRNSVLSQPNRFSCAVDTFLEISRYVIFPYLRALSTPIESPFCAMVCNSMNNFHEFLTRLHLLNQSEKKLYLAEIRELIWSLLRQKCPSFSLMNCDAQFTQIFQESIFSDMSEDEKSVFLSSYCNDGTCPTPGCGHAIRKQVKVFVHYVSQIELLSFNISLNDWYKLFEKLHFQNLVLYCEECKTYLLHNNLSFLPGKLLFIDFSIDLVRANFQPSFMIHILSQTLSIKALVRCIGSHFTCAVYFEGVWRYIDDLSGGCQHIRFFSSYTQLLQDYPCGWFFVIYGPHTNLSDHDYYRLCGLSRPQNPEDKGASEKSISTKSTDCSKFFDHDYCATNFKQNKVDHDYCKTGSTRTPDNFNFSLKNTKLCSSAKNFNVQEKVEQVNMSPKVKNEKLVLKMLT